MLVPLSVGVKITGLYSARGGVRGRGEEEGGRASEGKLWERHAEKGRRAALQRGFPGESYFAPWERVVLRVLVSELKRGAGPGVRGPGCGPRPGRACSGRRRTLVPGLPPAGSLSGCTPSPGLSFPKRGERPQNADLCRKTCTRTALLAHTPSSAAPPHAHNAVFISHVPTSLQWLIRCSPFEY